MADFRKLRVWQHAYELALHAQKAANSIRGYQYSSLRSQLLRSAMSIPANIVEGREHTSDREFRRYLAYALASASELENHLMIARDMNVLRVETFNSLLKELIEVRKMLHGLINRLGTAA